MGALLLLWCCLACSVLIATQCSLCCTACKLGDVCGSQDICGGTSSQPQKCRTYLLCGRKGSTRVGLTFFLGSVVLLGASAWNLSWQVCHSAHERTGYFPGGCGHSGADTAAKGHA